VKRGSTLRRWNALCRQTDRRSWSWCIGSGISNRFFIAPLHDRLDVAALSSKFDDESGEGTRDGREGGLREIRDGGKQC
jgi:hypothetical protein